MPATISNRHIEPNPVLRLGSGTARRQLGRQLLAKLLSSRVGPWMGENLEGSRGGGTALSTGWQPGWGGGRKQGRRAAAIQLSEVDGVGTPGREWESFLIQVRSILLLLII